MKAFIVLGMHRSATSLVAQGLARSGVHMGDRLLGQSPDQPLGHWEDADFVRLNDDILSLAGGSWDDPPPEENIEAIAEGNRDFFAEWIERKERELWGWKDPRTVLTIPCFAPHLRGEHYIVVRRDPMEVAESLLRRNGMPVSTGVVLAKEYERRLRKFMEGQWRRWTSR